MKDKRGAHVLCNCAIYDRAAKSNVTSPNAISASFLIRSALKYLTGDVTI